MNIDEPALDSGERILAVDHQPRMLSSLSSLAEAHGLPLTGAECAEEARALLKTGRYGVLVVDLLHPQRAGQVLMDYIRQTGIDVHVIVSTADSSQSAVVQALRNGAKDFLRKPYAPEELILTLGNALESRRLSRENRSYQNRLQRSEQLYRFIVDRSPDLIYILDDSGHFTFINSAAERLLGYTPESLLGRHYSLIVLSEDLHLAENGMNERRTGERATRSLELRLLRAGNSPADERTVMVEISAMGIYNSMDADPSGKHMGTYGIVRDITERKHAEDMIRYQAHYDMLTGLPNRVLFKDRLQSVLAHHQRSGEKLAVLFLDLDRFKLVNDSLGHSVGDQLLERVAHRLRDCLREGDTLARLGGDEFTLLLPNVEQAQDAIRVAEKCVKTLSRAFTLEERDLHLGVSIGIAVSPDHGDTVETLIKHADVAMYHVKDNDRGRWTVYEPAMSSRVDKQVNIERGLRQALENNELELVYQPQIDVETGTITTVEALVRWKHPVLGMVSPADFIPVAEQTGAILPMSNWILRHACRTVLSWQGANAKAIRLAVNLSPLQVEQPDFVKNVLNILKQEQFPPQRLELEITEHMLMANKENVVRKMQQLMAHGITFAVDDFGTGYSSLSYLQRLPLQTLKIDQSFVQALDNSEGSIGLITAIIAMANGLGLTIVAEGVETESQLTQLRRLKCMQIQGYLFGKPAAALIDPDEFARLWSHATATPALPLRLKA